MDKTVKIWHVFVAIDWHHHHYSVWMCVAHSGVPDENEIRIEYGNWAGRGCHVQITFSHNVDRTLLLIGAGIRHVVEIKQLPCHRISLPMYQFYLGYKTDTEIDRINDRIIVIMYLACEKHCATCNEIIDVKIEYLFRTSHTETVNRKSRQSGVLYDWRWKLSRHVWKSIREINQ